MGLPVKSVWFRWFRVIVRETVTASKLPRLTRSFTLCARSLLEDGAFCGFPHLPSRPPAGRGVDARRQFTGGVFVPASLLHTAFKGGCGTKAPETGCSAHSALIPGGLEQAHLRCRGVPSSPSSGPVYGGPCIGSILAPMHCHVIHSHGRKVLRTRFLLGLNERVTRASRPGPPRYHMVNPAVETA